MKASKVPEFFKREVKILFNFKPCKLNMHGKISRITTERMGKNRQIPKSREEKITQKSKQTNFKTKKAGKKKRKMKHQKGGSRK